VSVSPSRWSWNHGVPGLWVLTVLGLCLVLREQVSD
jgi:hypothetical protein